MLHALICAFLPLLCTASELSVNDGGTWRSLYDVYVNDSGTWRTVTNVSVNDSGTWRTVYGRETVSVTVGDFSSGNFYGLVSGGAQAGAVTPTTYRGETIFHLYSQFTQNDFVVSLGGTGVAQNFFRAVVVQDTAGNFRTFLSGDVWTFTQGTSPNFRSTWQWGLGGGNRVWTSTASPRSVTFYQ